MLQLTRGFRAITVAGTSAIVAAAACMSAGPAHAIDTMSKPKRGDFQAAAYALDVVEDAVLLGRPLPPHDPALGDANVRLTVTTPGYTYTPWHGDDLRVTGSVNIKVSAKGLAAGPLTVWVKAGGHACARGTSSAWQRLTVPNGGTFTFALKDKFYSTAIFLRVSDVKGKYRYESVSVRVAPTIPDGEYWTPGELG